MTIHPVALADKYPYFSFHSRALPFIETTSEKSNWSEPYQTGPYRYCKAGKSIFFTHFRWQVDGRMIEVSRVEIVETWIKAANLYILMTSLQSKLHVLYDFDADQLPQHSPHRERIVAVRVIYKKVNPKRCGKADLAQTQALHRRLSLFLEQMGEFESSGSIHSSWPASSRLFLIRLEENIDISGPAETWPYIVLRDLIQALADTVNQQILLVSCKSQYQLRSPTIPRPVYKGKNGVEWLGEVNDWKIPPNTIMDFLSSTPAALRKVEIAIRRGTVITRTLVTCAAKCLKSYFRPNDLLAYPMEKEGLLLPLTICDRCHERVVDGNEGG